jgi:hypothetical protein
MMKCVSVDERNVFCVLAKQMGKGYLLTITGTVEPITTSPSV